jgi:hypothetical protein
MEGQDEKHIYVVLVNQKVLISVAFIQCQQVYYISHRLACYGNWVFVTDCSDMRVYILVLAKHTQLTTHQNVQHQTYPCN